jgi:hypothetical protein
VIFAAKMESESFVRGTFSRDEKIIRSKKRLQEIGKTVGQKGQTGQRPFGGDAILVVAQAPKVWFFVGCEAHG